MGIVLMIAISLRGYFSRAIYNSFKLIELYPNCHISYLFKLRSAIEGNNLVVKNSSINLNELYIALEKYPRKDIAKLLKGGFTSGFKINYTGPRLPLNTQ
jgi:hypothetical protein